MATKKLQQSMKRMQLKRIQNALSYYRLRSSFAQVSKDQSRSWVVRRFIVLDGEPLKAKLIIENRMRGCMEENYFLDQRKINRQIQL